MRRWICSTADVSVFDVTGQPYIFSKGRIDLWDNQAAASKVEGVWTIQNLENQKNRKNSHLLNKTALIKPDKQISNLHFSLCDVIKSPSDTELFWLISDGQDAAAESLGIHLAKLQSGSLVSKRRGYSWEHSEHVQTPELSMSQQKLFFWRVVGH